MNQVLIRIFGAGAEEVLHKKRLKIRGTVVTLKLYILTSLFYFKKYRSTIEIAPLSCICTRR